MDSFLYIWNDIESGGTPWNKGLTKDIDERVAEYGRKRKESSKRWQM